MYIHLNVCEQMINSKWNYSCLIEMFETIQLFKKMSTYYLQDIYKSYI